MATTKQISFARDLYREMRDERETPEATLQEMVQRVEKHRNDVGEFSNEVIEWALETKKTLPRKANADGPKVADGRYAIDYGNGVIKFFKVNTPEKGRWAGYTFVEEQASDEMYPVKNKARRGDILDEIAKNPEAAAALYGTELGVCGICGRTLTNAESRERGIGPVCAENRGW